MRFVSAASRESDLAKACAECAERVRAAGVRPDLLLVFVTPDHGASDPGEHLASLRAATGARHLVGCTGGGLIGGGAEHEEQPALTVLALALPGAAIHPYHFVQEEMEPAEAGSFLGGRLPELPAGAHPVYLVLAEPYTFDTERLLAEIDAAHPGAPALGGNASGGGGPGQQPLFLDDEVYTEGAIGVRLAGGFEFRALVSQGCRPIGRHLVITKAEGNVIFQVGGRPVLHVLKEILEAMPEDDQRRARAGLHVGRVINERQEAFKQGDFLIRNPIGIDPESGALAVGDLFRKGQTIQFHVRDAAAAAEDLRTMLASFAAELGDRRPAGGVLFSCNGRGERLFGVPNHDTGLVKGALGDVPLAGFFCAGEVGPVGGRNFLHGFTSALGFFLEPSGGVPAD
ncbi:MAG: FIST C-terminal domain-containing protein [Planctomycetes bacterium]|nr:FIST C-terminal domain-containing protein [Planctomycetota bacterium]